MPPNIGAPSMRPKHLAIAQEEETRLKKLYEEKVGVKPQSTMTIEEIEKGLANPEEEKARLAALAKDEDKEDLAATYRR